MNGGERYVIAVVHVVGIRIKRDLLQVFGKRNRAVHAHVFVHRVDKFVEVGAFGDALVGAVVVRVVQPRAFHDMRGELIDAFLLRRNHERFDVIAEIFEFFFHARREGQKRAVEHGVVKRKVLFPRVIEQRLHRFFADAAARHVDDAHDSLAVERVGAHAQICQNIFDFLAFVELEPAEHFIGNAVFGKFLLV